MGMGIAEARDDQGSMQVLFRQGGIHLGKRRPDKTDPALVENDRAIGIFVEFLVKSDDMGMDKHRHSASLQSIRVPVATSTIPLSLTFTTGLTGSARTAKLITSSSA